MTGDPLLHGDPATAFVMAVLLLFATGDDSDWRECNAYLNDPKRRRLWT